MNIGPELQYLYEQDSTNQMALEYLAGGSPLNNNVIRFVSNLKFVCNLDYPRMPPVYEEALYIYKLGISEGTFPESGLTTSEQTEKRFQQYHGLYKNGEIQRLKSESGNTYWHYLNSIGPYRDKIVKN